MLFKSFYAEVRLLIACKDASKIPHQRVVEMNQKLYMLSLSVHVGERSANSENGPDDNPNSRNGAAGPPSNNMYTDPHNDSSEGPSRHSPAGSGGGTYCTSSRSTAK